MVFNSLAFVGFLAVVLPLAHALPLRARNAALLVASYVFYGWWDWRFLALIAVSTLVDYAAALAISRAATEGARRAALGVSVAANLGILGFFKYFDFFVDSAVAALQALGVGASPVLLQVVLPVGISFYTFQTLAYTIDVYRGRLEPTRDPLTFALYVAYFPQLVAGPIERAHHLLPQLARPAALTAEAVRSGVTLLLLGWFKKVGLGDAVAPLADEVFADPGSYSASALYLGVWLFIVQLYGDFSGYSDFARGASRLLGVELMVNFDRPYLSQNYGELWRRWHISLSSWFMDYVYVPMGGSRMGYWRNSANLVGVFTLSGLWHGAGWNFVLWGFVNGLGMWVYRTWSTRAGASTAPAPLGSPRWFVGNFLTMQVFALALFIFRGDGLAGVWTLLHAVALNPVWLGYEGVYLEALALYAIPMMALDVWQTRAGAEEPMLAWSRPAQGVLLGSALIWIAVMGGVDLDVPFVYFQF